MSEYVPLPATMTPAEVAARLQYLEERINRSDERIQRLEEAAHIATDPDQDIGLP